MQIVPTPNPTLNHYYAALANYTSLGVTHEQGIRSAFRSLLEKFSRSAEPTGWTLVEEHTLPGSRKRPDGTLLDNFRIPRGYWEAKDAKDDLDAEIRSKIKLGYDLGNTIFEDTRRAVLYQNKQRVLEADLTKQDIFHYVYGLLHSPEYRERYKENLKRELPRIPLAGGEEFPPPPIMGEPEKNPRQQILFPHYWGLGGLVLPSKPSSSSARNWPPCMWATSRPENPLLNRSSTKTCRFPGA